MSHQHGSYIPEIPTIPFIHSDVEICDGSTTSCQKFTKFTFIFVVFFASHMQADDISEYPNPEKNKLTL